MFRAAWCTKGPSIWYSAPDCTQQLYSPLLSITWNVPCHLLYEGIFHIVPALSFMSHTWFIVHMGKREAKITCCHIHWTLTGKCKQVCPHGRLLDFYWWSIWSVYPLLDVLCFPERGKIDGSQGPDCPLNFLPLRQIARDHADHPSCWVCVLSRAFPAVQTMPEIHPSAEMERRRCSHRVCEVRPSSAEFLCSVFALECDHLMEVNTPRS